MANLSEIAAEIQRLRADIDGSLDDTSTRLSDSEALIRKIEELRRRSEMTMQKFGTAGGARLSEPSPLVVEPPDSSRSK